jgi:hypothetical protein
MGINFQEKKHASMKACWAWQCANPVRWAWSLPDPDTIGLGSVLSLGHAWSGTKNIP